MSIRGRSDRLKEEADAISESEVPCCLYILICTYGRPALKAVLYRLQPKVKAKNIDLSPVVYRKTNHPKQETLTNKTLEISFSTPKMQKTHIKYYY